MPDGAPVPEFPDKPTKSFRSRLVLAMACLIAAVSFAALLVTRRNMDDAYRDLVSNQFKAQVEMFFERREARVHYILDAVRDATRNPRTVASFVDASPVADRALRLYADLGFELSPVLDRIFARIQRRSEAIAGAGAALPVPFFRVYTAGGEGFPVPAPDPAEGAPDPGRVPGMDEAVLQQRLQSVVPARTAAKSAPDSGNQAGYLVFPVAGETIAFEVLVLPIEDEYDGSLLGWLVFGTPVLSSEDVLGHGDRLKNGIRIGEHFCSETIPPALFPPISSPVAALDRPVTVTIDGEPHLLFSSAVQQPPGFDPSYQYALAAFPLAQLNAVKHRVGRSLGIFAAGLIVAGVLFSFPVANHITQPIKELVRGTNAIRRGSYDARLPVRRDDELGLLTRSFNSMAADLALKEKYRNVLDRVSDKRVADELLHGKLDLGGQILTASVLFCDIRGFTTLSAGMEPAAVVALLNEHMSALTAIAHRHNGVVDKFVGDEIMVLFGAPRSYGNDAGDAVRCAVEMIRERARLNASGGREVTVGIGVATGEVVAGCMGSTDRLNYTVLGESVNLAFRLCALARPQEAVIDEATRLRLPRDASGLSPAEQTGLKGFAAPVSVFRLTNAPPPTRGRWVR